VSGFSRTKGLREPEVEDLHIAVRGQLDIRRLQIAVHNAMLVRGFECFSNLPRDRKRLVHRNGALRNTVGQRGPRAGGQRLPP